MRACNRALASSLCLSLCLSLSLSLASAVLFYAGYFVWWPLIMVAPIPMSLAFLLAPSAGAAAAYALAGGFLVFRPLLHPLAAYGQEGVGLLSLWQACTLIPVAIGLWRGHRRAWSLAWLFPVLWSAAEVFRMLGIFGFPFSALALPCYEQRWMIQIADLGGMHLLSFALCLPGGAALQWMLAGKKSPCVACRLFLPVLLVWGLIGGYGAFRIQQVERELRPGPRVAVIQPDVPRVQGSISSYDPDLLLEELKAMSEESAFMSPQADLIVWPENILTIPLKNHEFIEQPFDKRMVPDSMSGDPAVLAALEQQWVRQQDFFREVAANFHSWTKTLGVPLLIGLKVSLPAAPDSLEPFHDYNAAQLYRAGGASDSERQFKMKLFPVGEILPGENHPFWRKVYQWPLLKGLAKRSARMTPGTQRNVFQVDPLDPDSARFVVGICSEILYPETSGVLLTSRRAGDQDGKAIDFLVSIANEGAFLRNRALLVTYSALPFRAVEGRMAIARSANTGISCFVDPSGRLHGHVRNDRGAYWSGRGVPEADAIARLLALRRAQGPEAAEDPQWAENVRQQMREIERLRAEASVSGFKVEPLRLTDRVSPFQRGGYWFRWLLLTAGILTVFGTWTFPKKQKPPDK